MDRAAWVRCTMFSFEFVSSNSASGSVTVRTRIGTGILIRGSMQEPVLDGLDRAQLDQHDLTIDANRRHLRPVEQIA